MSATPVHATSRRAAADIAAAVLAYRYRHSDEDQLQEAVAAALTAAGFAPEREVRLNARDRIDLLVDRVGVEVKIAGAPSAVLRQLVRYAASDRIDALVLVTCRARHAVLAGDIGVGGSTPLIVAQIGSAA